ncbi:MAG TPA: hypothetical protein PLR94_09145, partial [Accumulibacter sp.]|uniref:hypothetical protein n=1 Tax=Accumulibacter sp. TaxID=2053492 RepID=UPI002D147A9D
REETTPPVTNTYLVMEMNAAGNQNCSRKFPLVPSTGGLGDLSKIAPAAKWRNNSLVSGSRSAH